MIAKKQLQKKGHSDKKIHSFKILLYKNNDADNCDGKISYIFIMCIQRTR